jgi:hypothetical protein
MTDIRLVQPTSVRIWKTVSTLAVIALLFWASALVFGDRTVRTGQPGVGAEAGFGEQRGTVLPAKAAPFADLSPPGTRDLGRLVHLTGHAESRMGMNSLWVRTPENFRILVRFEPAPPPGLLAGVGPGSPVAFNGYITSIGVAEFMAILDSLGVGIPRPPPARKFGDLPDPGFAAVDSLFIEGYYISVRPEGIPAGPDPPPPQR